jgi:hypothetical protein
MLNDTRFFLELKPITIDIATGNKSNNHQLRAVAKGTATIRTPGGQMLVLREALYVPNITRNLLSLVQLVQHAAHIVASPTGFTVQIDGHQILEVDTSNLIFEMVGITHAPQEATANLTVVPQPAKESLTSAFETWHRRLGHASAQQISAALAKPLPAKPKTACMVK